MTYTYKTSIEVDPVKGLLPYFDYAGSGGNQFSIEEWPDIRSDLRKEILKEVPEEFESYLWSDRVGESYSYTLGTIELDEDTGELVQQDLDTSLESLRDAFDLT